MKNLLLLIGGVFIFSSFQTKEAPVSELNAVLDGWHTAAAKADLDAYFSCVTDDFVFLGTDPKERWDKAAFKSFCKPYFDQGKGWEFKSSERNWIFSENGKTAWFDEKLDTWMKDCRGSGVMVKKGKQWKLAYYNLTVLIENEKIQLFIQLREQ